jgi:hypothetical protein
VSYQFNVTRNVSYLDVILVDIHLYLEFALYKTTGSCALGKLLFTKIISASDKESNLLTRVPISAGNIYLLQVDGYNNTVHYGGKIYVQSIISPPNDSFCTPETLGTAVNCGSLSSQEFSNVIAARQNGKPSPGTGTDGNNTCLSQDGWCADDPHVQNSVWYQFNVMSNVTSIDVIWDHYEHADLQFALYKTTGSCVSGKLGSLNVTKVGANDDEGALNYAPKIINATVSAGNTYLLQVDGWNGATYSGGRINVRSFCIPPPNDSFCTSEVLGTATKCDTLSLQEFSNSGATRQNGKPSPGTGTHKDILVHPKMAGVQRTLMFKTLFGISSM